jgi:hypothetical protein
MSRALHVLGLLVVKAIAIGAIAIAIGFIIAIGSIGAITRAPERGPVALRPARAVNSVVTILTKVARFACTNFILIICTKRPIWIRSTIRVSIARTTIAVTPLGGIYTLRSARVVDSIMTIVTLVASHARTARVTKVITFIMRSAGIATTGVVAVSPKEGIYTHRSARVVNSFSTTVTVVAFQAITVRATEVITFSMRSAGIATTVAVGPTTVGGPTTGRTTIATIAIVAIVAIVAGQQPHPRLMDHHERICQQFSLRRARDCWCRGCRNLCASRYGRRNARCGRGRERRQLRDEALEQRGDAGRLQRVGRLAVSSLPRRGLLVLLRDDEAPRRHEEAPAERREMVQVRDLVHAVSAEALVVVRNLLTAGHNVRFEILLVLHLVGCAGVEPAVEVRAAVTGRGVRTLETFGDALRPQLLQLSERGRQVGWHLESGDDEALSGGNVKGGGIDVRYEIDIKQEHHRGVGVLQR